MNKKMFKALLLLIVAGIFSLVMVSTSSAFGTQRIDQDTEWTFYGYIKNTAGMFTDSKDYRMSGNDLSTMQTVLRTYTDIKFNNDLTGFVSLQFIHEPWYPVEEGSLSSNKGIAPADSPTLHSGHEYSEWWNVNQVLKEIYLNWQITPNTGVKVGRQIVIWGESIATRICDVIHMDDSRGAFTFADLDATRIPMYMIKGAHYLPSIDLEIEWLMAPNIEGKGWRLGRSASGADFGNAGQRFGLHPEDRTMPPYSYAAPDYALGVIPPGVAFPGSPAIVIPATEPFAVYGATAVDVRPNPFVPGLYTSLTVPDIHSDVIKSGTSDMRYGIRLGKMIADMNIFLQYYHTQQGTPTLVRGTTYTAPGPNGPATLYRNYYLRNPDINIIGASFSRDLDFGLIKGEVIWTPDYNYGVIDYNMAPGAVPYSLNDEDCWRKSDQVKYMLGWSGKFFLDINKGAAFDVDLEHNGTWIPKSDNVYNGLWATWATTWDPGFSVRVSTQWQHLWTTQVITSYNLGTEGGLFMPSLQYSPNWMKNRGYVWNFTLRYVRVFAKSTYDGIGILEQNDMVTLTSQFNF